MGVDHPRDDQVAGAIDPLGLRRLRRDDSTVRDRDIATAKLTPADVDEAALEQQRPAHDARA